MNNLDIVIIYGILTILTTIGFCVKDHIKTRKEINRMDDNLAQLVDKTIKRMHRLKYKNYHWMDR